MPTTWLNAYSYWVRRGAWVGVSWGASSCLAQGLLEPLFRGLRVRGTSGLIGMVVGFPLRVGLYTLSSPRKLFIEVGLDVGIRLWVRSAS